MLTIRLIFAMILMAIATSAYAVDPENIRFPKGSLTLDTYAAYADGLEAPQENIPSVSVGAGYFVFDNFSLTLDVNGFRAIQTGDNAWMTGVSAGFRHFLVGYDRCALFADVNFGPSIATARVPAGGTDFNFVTRTGLGVTTRLKDNLHLLVGVRYFHLSNAQIEGKSRNPSINGVEGYVGLLWQLR